MTDRMFDKRGGFNYVTAEEAQKTPLEAEKAPRVVMPEEDFRALQAKHKQPHGMCRHFRLMEGQREAQDQQFFQRLFKDERWNKTWIGNPQDFGVCDIFPDRLLNRHNPGVCRAREAQFHSSRTGNDIPWAEQDTMVLCPWFENRLEKGEKIFAAMKGK